MSIKSCTVITVISREPDEPMCVQNMAKFKYIFNTIIRLSLDDTGVSQQIVAFTPGP